MACKILFLFLVILPFFPPIHAYRNDTGSALFGLPPGTNLTTVQILDGHGERNISYYESNGYAIVDGDVAYGTVAELLANVVPAYNSNVTRRSFPRRQLDFRAFSILATGPKWPGAEVKYKYDSADTETKVSVYINEAIRRWQVKNPFLKFTRVSAPSADPVAGVVTVTAAECGGCYASVIGYSSNANLVVNLQQSCGLDTAGCFSAEATHELGHVLGLLHEAQRPDAPQHVTFHCENLEDFPSYPSPDCCGPSICCGFACNFIPVNSATLDAEGPYQMNSIMQYRADAFAVDGTISLEGVSPADIVPQFNPSFPDLSDHERICKIYSENCKGLCGNGIVEPANGEECDDGNIDVFDSCSNTCKVSVCGNNIIDAGEECDDGNLIDGDGCSSTCKIEPPCATCNPTSGLNNCDITTSCITTSPGNHHCACRAGFKANAPDLQISLHYRLPFPGQEYRVFVAPGVACDTLCNNPFGAPQDICNEVKLLSQCQ